MQPQHDYPRVAAVIDLIADWWKRRERRSQYGLAGLPDSDVARIARDVGLSAGDLRALDRRGDRELALPRMMAALQLDPMAVARSDPETFRDMQRVCAMCDCTRRCERDLVDGDAAINFEDYCPNAATLRSLC
jgi:hypothetical protein